MLKAPRHNAFTLTEFLVVLVIISILAALLFTAFTTAREGGRRTVCTSNQKQLYAAFQLYSADNTSLYPLQNQDSHDKIVWAQGLQPVVSNPEIFHCPSDGVWDQREEVRAEMSRQTFGKLGVQPSSSYIVNSQFLTRVYSLHDEVVPFKGTAARPSSTVLLCDGANPALGEAPYVMAASDVTVKYQYDFGNSLRDPSGELPEINGCCNGTCNCGTAHAPTARHRGRANVLFFDGHVKAMANAEWYFPQTLYLVP